MAESELTLPQLCGQLIVGGFAGSELPRSYARELERGQRGGAILFRRDLREPQQVAELCWAVWRAAAFGPPPIVGIDQEGGRVTRLSTPFLSLPPMRVLGRHDDAQLTHRAGEQVGRELAAAGFTVDFAPVLDVDSNPDNPVIGDRSFGSRPEVVGRHGLAFALALQQQGVAGCGKHFPGHGDTSVDSHFDLPVVDHAVERLERTELEPFRAASSGGVASLMSAHVVYRLLDDGLPATFSRAICTTLLRQRLGFEGLLFSDDLEMGAIATRHNIEQAAVRAVAAGCDALLICSDESLQHRAHEALVHEAEHSQTFQTRCRQAHQRCWALRQQCLAWRAAAATPTAPPASQLADEQLSSVFQGEARQRLADDLAQAAKRYHGGT